MTFEEILPYLRVGKTARYPNYNLDNTDGYWIAGYISLMEEGEKTLTLHRVNKEGKALRGLQDWGIKNWAIMSDEWEILDEDF